MFENSSLAWRAAIASLLGSCFAVALLAYSHRAEAQETLNISHHGSATPGTRALCAAPHALLRARSASACRQP